MVLFAVDASTIISLNTAGYLEEMISVLKNMKDGFLISDEIRGELGHRIDQLLYHETPTVEYLAFNQDRQNVLDKCDAIARREIGRSIHGGDKDYSVIGVMKQYDAYYIVSEDHHLKIVANGFIKDHMGDMEKPPRTVGLPGMLESICARDKKTLSIPKMIKWCLDIYGERELPYCTQEHKENRMSMAVVKDRYRPYPQSIYKTIGIGGG